MILLYGIRLKSFAMMWNVKSWSGKFNSQGMQKDIYTESWKITTVCILYVFIYLITVLKNLLSAK